MGVLGKSWKVFTVILLLICISIVTILITRPIGDSDLWLHMLYGKYILQNRTLVVDHTVFSWTPSTNEIIYCAWIPQVVFYLIYDYLGFNGIFILRFLVLFLCYILVFYYAYRLNVLNNPVGILIIIVGHYHAQIGFIDKATLFSTLYFYFILFLYWYLSWRREFNPKLFYLFPLIMLIWVNSHGYFIFGCITYACLFIGEILNIIFYPHLAFKREYRLNFFFSMILSGISILITPYGFDYIYQIIYLNILGKYDPIFYSTIAEYREYFKFFNLEKIVFPNLSVLLIVILILLNLKDKRVNISVITLNLFSTYIFTKYERTSFFWGPILIFTGIYLLNSLNLGYIKLNNSINLKRYFIYVLNTAISIVIVLIFYYTVLHKRCEIRPLNIMTLDEGVIYDKEAINYIRENLLDYRGGNSYVTGSILAFELWPRLKVMIDARQFPYQQFYEEYHKFDSDPDNSDLLRKYKIDYYVLSTFNLGLVDWFSRSPDWKLAFLGKNMWIFVRKDIYLPLENFKISENVLDHENIYKLLHLYNFSQTYIGKDFTIEIINKYKSIESKFCEINKVYETVLSNIFKADEYYLKGDYTSTINLYLSIPREFISNYGYLADSILKLFEKSISQSDFMSLIKYLRIYNSLPIKDDYNLIVMLWYIKEYLQYDNIPIDIKNILSYYEFYKNIYISKRNFKTLIEDNGIDELYQIINNSIRNENLPRLSFKYHSNPICLRP